MFVLQYLDSNFMKIIHPNGAGVISILIPTGELSDEDVALKDVPDGVPFLFIEDADIPDTEDFRDAWDADFSTPDGYGMGHIKWSAMILLEEETKRLLAWEKSL